MSAEQQEILDTFRAMLEAATADGGRKREAGEKVLWKIDPDHTKGLFSHLRKWVEGEEVDADSGSHPLVHLAWRALAIAWQETQARERRDKPTAGPLCLCHDCRVEEMVNEPVGYEAFALHHPQVG